MAPLERYTLPARTVSLVELVEVLDQLPFLDWTIHQGNGNGVTVEITFNQFCQPESEQRSVVSAKGQQGEGVT